MIDFLDLHDADAYKFVCKLLINDKEVEVSFDTSILVPVLKEGDPIVQQMLEEADSVNMRISAFLESETSRLEGIKNQIKQELNGFLLYYANVPKSTLSRALNIPATDPKTPTATYLKMAAEHANDIYGVKHQKDLYDHTDRLIFSGETYRNLLEKQELVEGNIRKLKHLLDQRKSMLMSVRSLNTNFRSFNT